MVLLNNFQLFVLGLTTIPFLISISEQKVPIVKFYKMGMSYHNKSMYNVTHFLKAYNRTVATASVTVNLHQIEDNLLAQLRMFKHDSQFRPFLVNVKLDYCKFLNSSKGNIYFNFVREMQKKADSNILGGCPFKANTNYYTRNMIINGGLFSQFAVPFGRYRFDFTVYRKGKMPVPNLQLLQIQLFADYFEAP